MKIPSSILQEIFKYAETEYPKECCGMLLEKAGRLRILFIQNLQDQYHQQDPKNFPRTSRDAYFMDPQKLLEIHKEIRSTQEKIKIIFHSHIDSPAVFSAEDKRMALENKEPLYPETDYLIASIQAGKAQDWKLYRWNASSKNFEVI